MKKTNTEVRYNLRLPEEVYEELGKAASVYGTTRLELIRKFIRLGLLAQQVNESPDSGLYIKRGDEIERILLM